MNIATYIDHTLLKPTASQADIAQLCNEAKQYGFAAVCVPPVYVRLAKILLQDTAVKIATVIGFPFGYCTTTAKIEEIKNAIVDGADELDMVINLTAVKNEDWEYLDKELTLCTNLTHAAQKKIKIIVESGLLSEAELISCCALVRSCKADYIKTSTGYADKGATVEAVRVMRTHVSADTGIKASAGIRTFAFAKELIDAGATRIGTSAGLQIVADSLLEK